MHDAIAFHHIAFDVDRVPFLRVSNIVDRHVIMLTPEKRGRIEWRAYAHHIERRDLSLPLRDHPVLDADTLTRNRVWPTGNVAGRADVRRACFLSSVTVLPFSTSSQRM